MGKIKIQCIDKDILVYSYKNKEVKVFFDKEVKKCWFSAKDIENVGQIRSFPYRLGQLQKKDFVIYPIYKRKVEFLQNDEVKSFLSIKFIQINSIEKLMTFSKLIKGDIEKLLTWLYQTEENLVNSIEKENIKEENQKLKEAIERYEDKIKELLAENHRLKKEVQQLGFYELGESQKMSDLRIQLEDKEREIQPLKEQIERLSKQNAEIYVAYRCCCHSRDEFEYKFKCLQEMYERNTGKKVEEDFYL